MSSADAAARPPLFAPAVAAALVIVGAFAFLAYFVLSAYAPEQSGDDGRATALSRSAIGFAGLVTFLRAQGIPVIVGRGPGAEDMSSASLTILTPEADSDPREVSANGPVLMILPKWRAAPHPGEPGWVVKGGLVQADAISENLLEPLWPNTSLSRAPAAPVSRFRSDIGGAVQTLGPVESLQTLSGGAWVRYLSDAQGRPVLVKDRNAPHYVLADPDLMNTHGLKALANARWTAEVIRRLRTGNGPVVIDVTLVGLRRSPNLLRLVFEPPLLGVTLVVLFVAALMGVHAAQRFGTPRLAPRAFAFGKQALADNSAGLVALARREHRMAIRYAQASRDAVGRAVGVAHKASGDALTQALEKLPQGERPRESLSALFREAEAANNREDLMRVARKLHRWRQEMMHGR